MIKIILLVLIGAVLPATAAPFLAHSKAVVAGQSGDHAAAQKLLQDAIVERPQDAALLYDAGVSEFKCGNYTNAVNYFEKVAQYAEKQAFQHEALFNAGNAHTHLKEYDAALQSYEKILADDATHERARHNYEVVKKLKEQEEQQQQQNQDQDKKQDQDGQDDQEKDQQDGSDTQDKDNQASNDDQSEGDDRSEENNQSRDGESGEDSGKKDGNEEKQQQQNQQNNKDNGSSEQNKQQQQKGGDKQQKEPRQSHH